MHFLTADDRANREETIREELAEACEMMDRADTDHQEFEADSMIRAAEAQLALYADAERFAADAAPTLEAAGATEARLVGYWIYAYFGAKPNEAARVALKTMGFRFASQRSKDRDRGAASVWYWRPPSAPHTFRPRRSRTLSMQEIEQRHGARAI
jgi:hypothetical protein